MSFNKSKLAVAVAAAAGLTFSSGAFATDGILQIGNGMAAHGQAAELDGWRQPPRPARDRSEEA